MRRVNRVLVWGILISLLLGQLARVTVNPRIAFYPHDVFLLLALLVNYRVIGAALDPDHWTFRQAYNGIYLIFFPIFSWYINQNFSLVPLLYLLRLLVYLGGIWVLARVRPFSQAALRKLLVLFFLLLAGTGLAQYLLWPDTRLLEYLGWDNHYYRLIGTWLDPAFTGLGLTLGLVYLWHQRKAFERYPWWRAGMVTLLIAIIFTYSRSAYLALLGVILLELVRLARRGQVAVWWRTRRRLLRLLAGLLVVMGIVIAYLARAYPSDSTNLLRTNSLIARAQMFTQQLTGWEWWQWLVGRGVFVALPGETPELVAAGYKQTAAFPDNSVLLLVSFFGVPLAGGLIWRAGRYWWRACTVNPAWAEVLVCIIIHSQFNQSLVQPFIVVTGGLLWWALQTQANG